jgi:hypothetical protein
MWMTFEVIFIQEEDYSGRKCNSDKKRSVVEENQ